MLLLLNLRGFKSLDLNYRLVANQVDGINDPDNFFQLTGMELKCGH